MSSLPADATAFLDRSLGRGWRAAPLFGDASVRRYFRVVDARGNSVILAYYPEALRSEVEIFRRAYDAVSPHAPVPRILESCEIGVLQEDIGDVTLFEVVKSDRPRGLDLYRRAVDLLVEFQRSAPAGAELNPPFDCAKFLDEMEMTREFYVERLCRSGESASLARHFETLCTNLEQHKYEICHRDYHGENIHVINGSIFIIDYQDLRRGPDTYDLASLLRDRGVAQILGDDVEEELIARYRERLGADAAIRTRYFETLLQRTIKIIGTFAKQAVTRERTHYLDYIPPALQTIERCAREVPQYQELARLFPRNAEMRER